MLERLCLNYAGCKDLQVSFLFSYPICYALTMRDVKGIVKSGIEARKESYALTMRDVKGYCKRNSGSCGSVMP